MDRMIPPELLGLAPQPPVNPAAAAALGVPSPAPAGITPAPPITPASDFMTPVPEPQLGPAPQEPDPVLTALLGGPDKSLRDPELLLPDKERKGYIPMPDEDFMTQAA